MSVDAAHTVNLDRTYILKDLSLLDGVSDAARREIMLHLTPVRSENPGCPLLDRIPPEIRESIYSYLLTNPILDIRRTFLHSQGIPVWRVNRIRPDSCLTLHM